MKLKSVLNKLLTNSWVLKIVFMTSLVSVLSYIFLGNIDAFMFFVVMAALVRYFSRNMIIILGVPLILVNLYIINNNVITSYVTIN